MILIHFRLIQINTLSFQTVDSVWSGPNPAAVAALQQQMPNWNVSPLWGDAPPPKMKTEQEILVRFYSKFNALDEYFAPVPFMKNVFNTDPIVIFVIVKTLRNIKFSHFSIGERRMIDVLEANKNFAVWLSFFKLSFFL